MQKPTKIIAVEEHFHLDGVVRDAEPRSGLLADLGEGRIEQMDRLGIDMQVLSLVSPGIQAIEHTGEAIAQAKMANDRLAAACARYPARLAGFAALPTQDPVAAADELERGVRELGFKGGAVNGHTRGHYLDEDRFAPLWERAVDLDVPIYLHAAPGIDRWAAFKDYPEFTEAAWQWTAETGAHALRLVASGLFERLPKARLMLGHLGEALPFLLQRIDSRTFGRFKDKGAPREISDYIRSNIIVTTSGAFSDAPLRCAITAMGLPSVLFAMGYPTGEDEEAVTWLRTAPLTAEEREAVAYGNAAALLRI